MTFLTVVSLNLSLIHIYGQVVNRIRRRIELENGSIARSYRKKIRDIVKRDVRDRKTVSFYGSSLQYSRSPVLSLSLIHISPRLPISRKSRSRQRLSSRRAWRTSQMCIRDRFWGTESLSPVERYCFPIPYVAFHDIPYLFTVAPCNTPVLQFYPSPDSIDNLPIDVYKRQV